LRKAGKDGQGKPTGGLADNAIISRPACFAVLPACKPAPLIPALLFCLPALVALSISGRLHLAAAQYGKRPESRCPAGFMGRVSRSRASGQEARQNRCKDCAGKSLRG